MLLFPAHPSSSSIACSCSVYFPLLTMRTSAPASARSLVHAGPAMICVRSRTFIPERGPLSLSYFPSFFLTSAFSLVSLKSGISHTAFPTSLSSHSCLVRSIHPQAPFSKVFSSRSSAFQFFTALAVRALSKGSELKTNFSGSFVIPKVSIIIFF